MLTLAAGILEGQTVDKDLEVGCDVCIVGSGPGGAVTAATLAQAGLGVIVLEEGGYFTHADFTMREKDTEPRLYQEGMARTTADAGIAIMQGRAVGGTTVVNWTTSFRTPEDVVAHCWQVTLPRLPELIARDGRFGPVLVKFLSTAVLLRINELLRNEARRTTCGSVGSSLAERLPDPATGVWTQIVQRERQGIVQRTLDTLEPGDREVIVLRLVEQRPAAEVGALLGITSGAVNVRLHRALGRLREALPAAVFDDLAGESKES